MERKICNISVNIHLKIYNLLTNPNKFQNMEFWFHGATLNTPYLTAFCLFYYGFENLQFVFWDNMQIC